MSSTYLALYYHLVFSTKHRQPTIDTQWRIRLHEYLGGTVNRMEAQSHGVGGTADHVHLLVELTGIHRIADFMRELKKSSTAWIRENTPCASFAWQEGYAALTVSASAVDEVRTYIQRQEHHHLHRDYRDEVLTLLRCSGIKMDERYFD
jgi:putative transposase